MWEIFMWFSGFKGKTPFYRIFLQREAFDFRHIEVDYFKHLFLKYYVKYYISREYFVNWMIQMPGQNLLAKFLC